jgi:hypothetical protein
MLTRPIFALKSAVVLALAPLPLLALLPREFSGHGDYAFAPFAAIGAVVLGRARLRRTAAFWPGHPAVGRGIVVVAGLTLLVAAVLASPWGAAMALLLTAAALAWEMGGRPALRAIIPSLLLLALCVPLPLGLDRTAIIVMARWAARWASHFLDLLGVAHVRSDQVHVFAGGRLDLSALLGGPFSPFALAALLLVVAQALGRNWWRSFILVATGLAFLPVVTAALTAARIAWAGGGGPDLVWAAASMALATGLAFSFDQWVGIPASLALEPHDPPADVVATAPAGPISGGGAIGRFATAAFAGLAVVQVWAIAAPVPAPPIAPVGRLPERIGEWVAEPSPGNGASAYRKGDRLLELTVSPATQTGGSPVADLEAHGWAVRAPAVVEDDPAVVRAYLELPAERFATVCICGLTADGRRVAPPIPLFGPGARARAALARPFGGDGRGAAWWVWAVAVTILPPSAAEIAEPGDLVRRACDLLGSRMRSEVGS